MYANAGERVADLIVILQEDHAGGGQSRRVSGEPRGCLLPVVPLTLVEKSVAYAGNEFLRAAGVVEEVAVAAAGERDFRGVMEVVVPHGIEPEAACSRADRRCSLACGSFSAITTMFLRRGRFRAARDELGDDVAAAVVEDGLRGVEPEAVEMKVANPVQRVPDHEIARAVRVRVVEVQRLAPVGAVTRG